MNKALTKRCPVCGKTFERHKDTSYKTFKKKCCSMLCANKHKSIVLKGKKTYAIQQMAEVNRNRKYNRTQRNHISEALKLAYKEGRHSVSGKNNPSYIDGRSMKKYYCIDCGKEIGWWTWCNGSKRCISCMMKTRTGEKANNWQGGKWNLEEYGPEFDDALKEQIRFRDKYKCRECGCTQIENGKQLDVHHIDYIKHNNDPLNLISLCVNCHSRLHGKTKRVYWMKHYQLLVRR